MNMKTKETDVEDVRCKNNANFEMIADTRDVNNQLTPVFQMQGEKVEMHFGSCVFQPS